MIFSLEALDAHQGDCLILHYGTQADPHFLLIDGGASGVYRSVLSHRLTRSRCLEAEPKPSSSNASSSATSTATT